MGDKDIEKRLAQLEKRVKELEKAVPTPAKKDQKAPKAAKKAGADKPAAVDPEQMDPSR